MKKQVREYSLPLETPFEVEVCKAIEREDSMTGRVIEFSSGVVRLPTQQFAEIYCPFSYKSVSFAGCRVFTKVVPKDSLYLVPDIMKTTFAIVPVAPPLVYAKCTDNELWIL